MCVVRTQYPPTLTPCRRFFLSSSLFVLLTAGLTGVGASVRGGLLALGGGGHQLVACSSNRCWEPAGLCPDPGDRAARGVWCAAAGWIGRAGMVVRQEAAVSAHAVDAVGAAHSLLEREAGSQKMLSLNCAQQCHHYD